MLDIDPRTWYTLPMTNANAIIAKYVAEASASRHVGAGSQTYCDAVRYLEDQARESKGVVEYNRAKLTLADRWVPANGGYETACTYRTNRRLLYCYNFATGRHAYLDLDQDRVLTDQEAQVATGN
jgi:hypothetical protein